MSKKIALLATFLFVLISVQSRAVSAVVFKLPDLHLLLPSATPTPIKLLIPGLKIPLITIPPIIPSSTPVPPTATPIPPTLTPVPPTVTETPINEEILPISEEESSSISPTITSVPTVAATSTISPPAAPITGGLTQSEMILGGIGGVFGLTILVLLWPKVKRFIHDKTG